MLAEMREYLFGKSPTGEPLKETAEALSFDSLMSSAMFTQYNPDDLLARKGHKIYKEMMHDEQVKAVVRFHRDAVTGRRWTFEDNPLLSDDENELRKTVLTAAVSKMSGSFKTRLDMMMSSIYNGFSLVEKTFNLFTLEGRQWAGIESLRLKPFETFYFNLNEFGDLVSLEQQMNGSRLALDIKQFIHNVQNADVHEYYGQSELRECHRAWWCKDIAIKLNNIFLERVAAGFVWAQPINGKVLTAKSAEYVSVKQALASIRTSSAMLMPADMDVNVEHPKDSQAFDRAIVGHDKAIAKALLMPNLLGLSEQGPNGSRALGDTQLEAFLWMLDSEAGTLEEVVNEQLFQDLANLNFPDGLYPRWTLHELSDKKVMEIMEKWAALVTGNAVKPTEADNQHIRSALDFPPPVAAEDAEDEAVPVDPSTALTGVQVTSMMEIVDRVAIEKIPRDTGIQILLNAFPITEATAEAIMGEVGKGFLPKGTPDPDPDPDPDDDSLDDIPELDENGDPIEGDPSEGDPDETIIGDGGTVNIEASMAAASARVAFAVIDKGTSDLAAASVDSLSTLMLAVIKPVTDDLREVDVLGPEDSRFTFNSRSIIKVQKQNKRMLGSAWQLGIKHAKNEVDKAAKKQMKVSFARLDQNAAEYFDNKSFVITGKLTADMKAIIENTISQGIKTNLSTATTVEQIYTSLGNQGFLTKADAESEMAGILGTQEGAATAARLNTVVRTNSFEALNEARYSYFTDPNLDGFVVAMEYSAILDGVTTQICTHLDGQEHEAEGEVWGGMWRPPNHFNCRSLLVPITTADNWSEDPLPEILPQEGFK